jgi:dihydrofolate reductase
MVRTRGAIGHDGAVTKTQYFTATTVDGYIADTENSLEWLFEVPANGGTGHEAFSEFFAGIGAMAWGRTTFDWVYAHERLDESPEKWQKWYAGTPCWVFTHREAPEVQGADIRFVQGDVAPVHEEMVRAADGKNIWLAGGGELVGTFADAGLLDEILLGMQPVFLGAGAPLLPRRLTSKRVRLESVTQNGQQVQLVYSVRPPEPA